MNDKLKYKNDNFDRHVQEYLDDELSLEINAEDAKENGWGKTAWRKAVERAAKKTTDKIQEEEKKRRREEIEKEREELAKAGGLVLERGDNAELASLLVEKIAADNGGEPPAFHRGKLWRYEENRGMWTPVSNSSLSQQLQEWAPDIYIDRGADKRPAPMRLNNVSTPIEMAKDLPTGWGRGEVELSDEIQGSEDTWLAGGPKGVAFADCFLSARRHSGRFIVDISENSAENRATAGYPFALDIGGSGGRFAEYIDQIFDGADDKAERIKSVQQYFGACLMGIAPDFNKAMILYGPPGTGKGTLVKIIARCMPGRVAGVQPSEWDEPQMIAQLDSTRLNVVSELSYGDLKDANMVKRVVSGDGMTAKEVYQKPYYFEPSCGHVITANEDTLPSVPNADEAFWDRFLAVPVENRFRDTDKERRGIADSITDDDMPAAVAWMVQGAMSLCQDNRFTVAPSGAAVINKWRGVANSAAEFISQETTHIYESARNCPLVSDVYQIYRAWAQHNGYRPVSLRKFTFAAKAAGRYARANGSRFLGEVSRRAREISDESSFSFKR